MATSIVQSSTATNGTGDEKATAADRGEPTGTTAEIQRSETAASVPPVGDDVREPLHSSGGGRPLSEEVRSTVEPQFDRDLSTVRIHDGGRAEQLCETLNARAFTHGSDVYVGSGVTRSETQTPSRLLAHELTHVVQQGHAEARPASETSVLPTSHTPSVPSIQRQVKRPPDPSTPPSVGDARFFLLRVNSGGRVELLVREPGLPVGTVGLGIRFDETGTQLIGSDDPLKLDETYTVGDVQQRIHEAIGEPGVEADTVPPGLLPGTRQHELLVQALAARTSLALGLFQDEQSEIEEPPLRLDAPSLGAEPFSPSFGGDESGFDLGIGGRGPGSGLQLELDLPELDFEFDSETGTEGSRDDEPAETDPSWLFPTLDFEGEYRFEPIPADALVGLPTADGSLMAAGPISASDAETFESHVGRRAPDRPDCGERYIIYSNDGNLPNLGSGSDQFLTAFFQMGCRWNPDQQGYTDAAFVLEMHTPPGLLPEGAPRDSTQDYTVPFDYWLGLVYGTFQYRLTGDDDYDVSVTWHLGANSLDGTDYVQYLIHEYVSDSPFFPWPSGIEPYVGLGLDFERRQELLDLGWVNGRIVFDANALVSTHRSRATARATLEIETGEWRFIGADWSLAYSEGASGRLFARYNDGREQVVPGAEFARERSLGVNMSVPESFDLGLHLTSSVLTSTDPAAQVSEAHASTPNNTSPVLFFDAETPDSHFGHGGIHLTFTKHF